MHASVKKSILAELFFANLLLKGVTEQGLSYGLKSTDDLK